MKWREHRCPYCGKEFEYCLKPKKKSADELETTEAALRAWVVILAIAFCIVFSFMLRADEPYDRSQWGRWMPTGEIGENGCRWDSRHTALRDSARPGSLVLRDLPGRACRVVALSFHDRYTGERVTGPGHTVDVDHIVPLSEAHRSGGWLWDAEKKSAFFNFADNHIPTPEKVNAAKSDRDPGGQNYRGGHRPWLPPDPAARCWYADRWIAVKMAWGLSFDDREERALVGQLGSCQIITEEGRMFLLAWSLRQVSKDLASAGISHGDLHRLAGELAKLGFLLRAAEFDEGVSQSSVCRDSDAEGQP